MNRENYLKLKYCPETPYCKVVRAGVIVVGAIILLGVAHNLGLLIWSFVRLAAQ